MNRYKALAANTIILGLGQFGSKFLIILMMGFYQATLGTAGYGEINNIIDTAVLLMSVATLSIGESIIRFGLDSAFDALVCMAVHSYFLLLIGFCLSMATMQESIQEKPVKLAFYAGLCYCDKRELHSRFSFGARDTHRCGSA